MRKIILPIPLILLIPIVMLLVVIVAGLYRFSLNDHEIMAKFPSQQVKTDTIVELLTGKKTTNPITIIVPETKAFALISELDVQQQIATGGYDSGAERGIATVWLAHWHSLEARSSSLYVAPVSVSNQGSGRFYYLGLFKFDALPQRLVMVDAIYLGDRIHIKSLEKVDEDGIAVVFNTHDSGQSFVEQPVKRVERHFTVDENKLKSAK
ncbi:hypothetical protein FC652_00455 [Vibrio sp. 05-20-BW147]|uniref:hypothetical protein n=1 Tax=Vibrio sp. 05-20-BW147 TaxID=2575834 RepID=UPI0015936176|nr:hypothetical protein [Vibrio sp. 05-20-BW147]NVC61597.1 hypothetical protein [Vibrio sp. 05-20-BW147]